MARRRRSSRSNRSYSYNRARRDASRIANPSFRLPRPFIYSSSLRDIEDNRRYHPFVAKRLPLPRRDIEGRTLKVRTFIGASLNPVSFLTRTAVLCVRRQRRKEVLFASRRAGRSGQHRPKFNQNSKILCRR